MARKESRKKKIGRERVYRSNDYFRRGNVTGNGEKSEAAARNVNKKLKYANEFAANIRTRIFYSVLVPLKLLLPRLPYFKMNFDLVSYERLH